MTSRALSSPWIEGRDRTGEDYAWHNLWCISRSIGNDPQNLRDYYAGLFGWEFDTPAPVAQEVSEVGFTGFGPCHL